MKRFPNLTTEYPSSHNHGSVENGCISNMIVTFQIWNCSLPWCHDYREIKYREQTGGLTPPTKSQIFLTRWARSEPIRIHGVIKGPPFSMAENQWVSLELFHPTSKGSFISIYNDRLGAHLVDDLGFFPGAINNMFFKTLHVFFINFR